MHEFLGSFSSIFFLRAENKINERKQKRSQKRTNLQKAYIHSQAKSMHIRELSMEVDKE